MIRSQHKPFFVHFFNVYSRLMINLHFKKVTINTDSTFGNAPILLLGNHFSWWDGFFMVYANLKLFHRKLHVMMLEEQLQQRMFLNKAGAFSIKKGTRSVLESLDYCVEILGSKSNLLVMFPQGEIQSTYISRIKFEKGIGHLLSRINSDVQLVFMSSFVDYFSSRKPQLNIYLESYYPSDESALSNVGLENAYNHFYNNCRDLQKE